MASGPSSNPLPPLYTDTLARSIIPPDDENLDELPAYSQHQQSEPVPQPEPETKNFDYQLDKQGKPLLVMTLAAWSHSQDMPTFLEGRPVKGKINLKLDRLDSINSAVVTVKGLLAAGGLHETTSYTFVFLDQAQMLWLQEGLRAEAVPQESYTWPFSLDLPEEIAMVERVGQPPKMFRLPQTFDSRSYLKVRIIYEISVRLSRKGILKFDESLSAPFRYIPVVRPPPLTQLRRLAYEEGTPLLGPQLDPDGWYLQKSVQVKGMLFNNKSACAECKLFLAKPLSYTRGSVIPLFISLESDDNDVLNLLSSPKAIAVRVRRCIKYAPERRKMLQSNAWRGVVEHSQRAVWWPAREYSSGENGPETLRLLNGELHLKPTMLPTSSLENYKVDYSLVLLRFDTPGFKVADSEGRLLLEQPVTIVTSFAPGVRPRMSTPPNYAPDAKRTVGELRADGEFNSGGFY